MNCANKSTQTAPQQVLLRHECLSECLARPMAGLEAVAGAAACPFRPFRLSSIYHPGNISISVSSRWWGTEVHIPIWILGVRTQTTGLLVPTDSWPTRCCKSSGIIPWAGAASIRKGSITLIHLPCLKLMFGPCEYRDALCAVQELNRSWCAEVRNTLCLSCVHRHQHLGSDLEREFG